MHAFAKFCHYLHSAENVNSNSKYVGTGRNQNRCAVLTFQRLSIAVKRSLDRSRLMADLLHKQMCRIKIELFTANDSSNEFLQKKIIFSRQLIDLSLVSAAHSMSFAHS